MATSGALTDWIRDLAGTPAYADLLREAADAGPGASGLITLPYFAGERSPFSDPYARGAIVGLTLTHGRGDIYRAFLEATAFGARHILESMADTADVQQLTAVGGGVQGGLWTQIVSDVTQLQQVIPRETIGASYGDARLAGIAGGLLNWDDPWNATASEVTPNADVASLYDELYETYRHLYPALRDAMHKLAQIQLSRRLRPEEAQPSAGERNQDALARQHSVGR
jgi:xylulokinase